MGKLIDKFTDLLNQSADVYRPTVGSAPNEYGERDSLPGTKVLTGIKLCIQPDKEKFEVEVNGVNYWSEHIGITPIAVILVKDTLIVGSDKYLVSAVEDAAGQNDFLRLRLIKL
jgi:hypothetical protein